jgi:hypothetical protein
MKKISSLVAVLALAAVGLFTTSCSDNDNPVPTPKVIEDVTVEQTNVIVVKTNVVADVTFAGDTKRGKTVMFETKRQSGILTISATGYFTETREIEFSEKFTVANIVATLVQPSTNQVAQADAKGDEVSNDSKNASATGINAFIAVPKDVVISENTTDPFSLVVFTPESEIGAVQLNETKVNPVVGFICAPDGAKFNPAVAISAYFVDAAGCKFVGPDGQPAIVEGNKVTIFVDHFSTHNGSLEATLVSSTPDFTRTYQTVRVTKGVNTISIPQTVGFTSSVNPMGVKYSFLESCYGTYGTVYRDAEFEVDADGSAVIEITQKYEDVVFVSGSETFSARVYLDATATVFSTSADTNPDHSGGSN